MKVLRWLALIAGTLLALLFTNNSQWPTPESQHPDIGSLLTLPELAWLQKHQQIRIGFDPHHAPMDFIRNKQFSGLSRNYLEYLGNKLGIEFSYGSESTWSATYQAALGGKYDVLSGVHPTLVKRNRWLFSKPYFFTKKAIIKSNRHQNDILDLNDLHGKTLAVIAYDEWAEALPLNYPGIKLEYVETVSEALREVAIGSADAYIGSLSSITYYLNEDNISNLDLQLFDDREANLAFAVRTDWPMFVNIINKVIANMPKTERQAIQHYWIDLNERKQNQYRQLAQILGMFILVVIALLIMMWIWNRSLASKVATRTHELYELNLSLEKLVEERTRELEYANQQLIASRQALLASNQHLTSKANSDELTGIANRRQLNDFMQAIFSHLTDHMPISLLMIDVDHFKQYNDHFGHQKGDQCLQHVAKVLAANMRRETELVARYGGEEFAIFLTHCPQERALSMAESKRMHIQSLHIPHPKSTTSSYVTVSIGVVTLNNPAINIDSLVKLADQALYSAKKLGRNQVYVTATKPLRLANPNKPKNQGHA